MSHQWIISGCIFLVWGLVACSPGQSNSLAGRTEVELSPAATQYHPIESRLPKPLAVRSEESIQTPTTELTQTPTIVPTQTMPLIDTQVLSFRVSPTGTTQLGETISIDWQTAGERAELCWLDGRGPTVCQPVPLIGGTTLTVDQEALSKTGIGLRVTQGTEFEWAIVDMTIECHGYRDWFFADSPSRCPADHAETTPAAVQFFERGFMIWTESPDAFYVFYDEEGSAQRRIYARFAAPYDFGRERLVTDTPPTDLLAPISGFGQLWRGELSTTLDDDLRGRLGWALGPEYAFESARQCEMSSHPRSWTCYLQAPDGRVLRLWPDSTAQANLLWRVVSPSD